MEATLSPCPHCTRHVRAGDAVCPFCAEALPEGFGEAKAEGARAPGRTGAVTRGALLFAGASLVAACSGETAIYGPGPVRDASVDAADAAPGDAGDAAPPRDAATDTGPVALYGPAPVRDAGGEG